MSIECLSPLTPVQGRGKRPADHRDAAEHLHSGNRAPAQGRALQLDPSLVYMAHQIAHPRYFVYPLSYDVASILSLSLR
jgi:hypothetical protein